MSLPPVLGCLEQDLVRQFYIGDMDARIDIVTQLISFDSSLFEVGHINSFRRDRYELHDECVRRISLCMESLSDNSLVEEDTIHPDDLSRLLGLET